jgi:biopolymer transport protein ExbB
MQSATVAHAASNPYGLQATLTQGGIIAQATFGILLIMSAMSWYVLFTKLFEQHKIMSQARKLRTTFWSSPNVRDGAAKLEKNSAYRQIVDDGLRAQEEHVKLTDPIDAHEWVQGSLSRSQGAINSKLGTGLSILATVGSTAPFVGLFGTVIGIYRALIRIGASGQASIDAVAGPVGESLIMTALGLAVAVPAVLAYNWLARRNKVISEDLSAFTNDLHGYMVSGGSVRPQGRAAASAPAPKATPAPAR